MALSDDPNNPPKTSIEIAEKTEQVDLPARSLDELVVEWKTTDSPWVKGDMIVEYVHSAKASGTNLAKNAILQNFADSVGEKPSVIRSYEWLSRDFPDKSMRKDELSWSNYRTIAKLKTLEEQMHWIDIAIEEKLVTRDLEERIERAQNKPKKCTNCTESLPIKGKLKLHKDRILVGTFCSYECLIKYSVDANKKY
jgi:hypothetical protein